MDKVVIKGTAWLNTILVWDSKNETIEEYNERLKTHKYEKKEYEVTLIEKGDE